MTGDSILRLAQVRLRVNLSPSTIYARMAEGDFPMVRRDRGLAFWLESEIDAYIEKVKARASVGPSMGSRRPRRQIVDSKKKKMVNGGD